MRVLKGEGGVQRVVMAFVYAEVEMDDSVVVVFAVVSVVQLGDAVLRWVDSSGLFYSNGPRNRNAQSYDLISSPNFGEDPNIIINNYL